MKTFKQFFDDIINESTLEEIEISEEVRTNPGHFLRKQNPKGYSRNNDRDDAHIHNTHSKMLFKRDNKDHVGSENHGDAKSHSHNSGNGLMSTIKSINKAVSKGKIKGPVHEDASLKSSVASHNVNSSVNSNAKGRMWVKSLGKRSLSWSSS